MLPRYPLVMALLFLWAFAVSAQQKRTFSFGANAYYGFVYRHTAKIGALTNTHPYGFEVYANQITTGTQPWHRLYCYPEVGLALGMVDFHHPKLGKVFYGITYLEKPFTLRPVSALRLKIGWGLGYTTHPYQYETNFQNAALSNRFSYVLRGELYWTQRLTPACMLKSGLMLTHLSNGAFKMPNLGANVVAWNVGFSYLPHPERAQRLAPDTVRSITPKGYALHLSSAFTIKEVKLPGSKKYVGMVLSAYVNRRISSKSAINAGLDGTFNTAEKFLISQDTTLRGEHKPDFKRGALTLGHELFISNRLSLLTQLGIYVYRPYPAEAPVYQRYGLKYYCGRNVFGGIMLKTHYGSADFVEWTIGLKLD